MTFELHRLQRVLQLLASDFERAQGLDFGIGVAILIFAAAFFIVGVVRVVEFQINGFSAFKRRTLVALHIVGVFCASVAMGLFALDVHARQTRLIGAFLASAFILLIPIHIYLGLIRRIRLKNAADHR